MTSRASTWPWVAAGGFVIVGWACGRLVWGGDQGAGYETLPFDWWAMSLIAVVGAPTMAIAGLLVPSRGMWRVLGYLALAFGALAMSYGTFWVWFGGFCIDPGEVCETSNTSRLAVLAAALLLVAGGWVITRARARFATAVSGDF